MKIQKAMSEWEINEFSSSDEMGFYEPGNRLIVSNENLRVAMNKDRICLLPRMSPRSYLKSCQIMCSSKR